MILPAGTSVDDMQAKPCRHCSGPLICLFVYPDGRAEWGHPSPLIVLTAEQFDQLSAGGEQYKELLAAAEGATMAECRNPATGEPTGVIGEPWDPYVFMDS